MPLGRKFELRLDPRGSRIAPIIINTSSYIMIHWVNNNKQKEAGLQRAPDCEVSRFPASSQPDKQQTQLPDDNP